MQSSAIIKKILTIQNNINEIISLKGIFNTGKEKLLKKLDTQSYLYYKNKVFIKEIFDSHKPEDPLYYELVQDPKSILKETYESTYKFFFLIRNDNSLMLNLIELSEKSFYEGLSDFFVNYLYENIINISFVEEKLIMMIYLLLEKLILTKLPDKIDENNKNVPALYLKDTFLNYVFKDLTRKIDIRNFLNKILRNTILKIDKFRMILSVDISVANKFLKISNRFLKKNATTKREIIQKKKKKFQPIVNKNILSKNSGNILFNRQRAIVLDTKEDDLNLDNLKISKEIETKNENEKQFQRRTTINNDENNSDNNEKVEKVSLNPDENLTNSGIYNKMQNNINENKGDDLDASKFKTTIMIRKKKPIAGSVIKLEKKDNIYSFFEDNSVTFAKVKERLDKYENKEKNNINLAMNEYFDNLRNKMINTEINELDEEDFEKKISKDIKKINTDIIDENDEYEDNEDNKEDEDLFSNSLMIEELKKRGAIQQEESFKYLIEKIKFNYNIVTGYINDIIKNIKENLIFSPYSLKSISKAIDILLKTKYNNNSNNQITPYQLYIFELNFLIGNIILPIIREPDFNGVISNDVISAFTYENLKIISKILNKMIKGTLFIKKKDPYMTMFNRFIIDTMPKLFELVDIISQQFDVPTFIKNLLKTSDKCNLPERDINYNYFNENPKENINYQTICFNSLIPFCLNITVTKYKNKFINESTNDEKKNIIQNFLNNQLAYNLHFSEEKMKNKYKFIYITKIFYSEQLNQILETMNSNNLITRRPNENALLFSIKKSLLETLKVAKKIVKENSYGLEEIDFRKDLLPQIMNKIAFIINNNTENINYNSMIFFTNYLYLNMSKIPNQYKENNYSLLFDELVNEIEMNKDNLKSNAIMEINNKLRAAEKNQKMMEYYASQIKKFKKFKCIEYFYNKILLPITFNITRDSNQIINNIKYESNKKSSTKNVNDNIIDYLETIKQPIKNMIEDFPDFHEYEDEYDNILDIEKEAKTHEAISDYFDSLSELIKKEKIFKQFNNEDIIYEFENYILIQLYDKLFPFQETTQDDLFYRKCQRLSFIKPENIKDMKIFLEEDKWEQVINALKEIDEKFSPIDKVKCVAKSLNILQDAINFTCGKGSLGVDDCIQPFIYALIKACPKNIISNYTYCDLYLNDMLKLKGFGASLSQFNLIINIVKDLKHDGLVGVTEEQFGKDEIEEATN